MRDCDMVNRTISNPKLFDNSNMKGFRIVLHFEEMNLVHVIQVESEN